MSKVKKSETVVPIDRRKSDRRGSEERRKHAAEVALERRSGPRREKVNRRRQIDPTTCERDYNEAELEFMHALERYKRASGRMFPTCSEILEVLVALGYQKSQPGPSASAPSSAAVELAVSSPAMSS